MLTVTWETKERTVSHDDIGPVVEMLDPHTKRFRVQTLTLESERFWFQPRCRRPKGSNPDFGVKKVLGSEPEVHINKVLGSEPEVHIN